MNLSESPIEPLKNFQHPPDLEHETLNLFAWTSSLDLQELPEAPSLLVIALSALRHRPKKDLRHPGLRGSGLYGLGM